MCVLYVFSCSGWDFWLAFIDVDVRLNVGFSAWPRRGRGGSLSVLGWDLPSLKLMTMGS